MELTAYAPGCGTVVDGVQLAELSHRELEDVRAAFSDHGLLFSRDQTLTPDQHLDFALRCGDIVINKFFGTTDTHPEIAEVRKEPGREKSSSLVAAPTTSCSPASGPRPAIRSPASGTPVRR